MEFFLLLSCGVINEKLILNSDKALFVCFFDNKALEPWTKKPASALSI